MHFGFKNVCGKSCEVIKHSVDFKSEKQGRIPVQGSTVRQEMGEGQNTEGISPAGLKTGAVQTLLVVMVWIRCF